MTVLITGAPPPPSRQRQSPGKRVGEEWCRYSDDLCISNRATGSAHLLGDDIMLLLCWKRGSRALIACPWLDDYWPCAPCGPGLSCDLISPPLKRSEYEVCDLESESLSCDVALCCSHLCFEPMPFDFLGATLRYVRSKLITCCDGLKETRPQREISPTHVHNMSGRWHWYGDSGGAANAGWNEVLSPTGQVVTTIWFWSSRERSRMCSSQVSIISSLNNNNRGCER